MKTTVYLLWKKSTADEQQQKIEAAYPDAKYEEDPSKLIKKVTKKTKLTVVGFDKYKKAILEEQ